MADPPTFLDQASAGKKIIRLTRDVAVLLVLALLVSFLIKAHLVRSFFIPSPSMERTLEVNDRILVNELVPQLIPVGRGDVVVFRDPGGWLEDADGARDVNLVGRMLQAVGLAPETS